MPKQFLPIGGVPVLMRTIDAFRRAFDDIGIVLVLPADALDYWQMLCEKHSFCSPSMIATGGPTRFYSVKNGLALLPDEADAVVGVHDAARPFVSTETIRRCYAAAAEGKAVVPVVPVVETLRSHCREHGFTGWGIQIPHAVWHGLKRKKEKRGQKSGFSCEISQFL